MGTKDKLTKLKCNESSTVSDSGSFGESPNPIGKLRVPTVKPLSQLCLHDFLLGRKSDVRGINIAENREQQLIGYILQSHGDLTTGKEESVSGATPPANQVSKIEQITIMGQTLRGNNGLQYIGLLKHTHKTRIEKLSIYPLLPTQGHA